MKKKFVSLVLSVFLVFSMSTSVLADSYEPNDTIGTAASISGSGYLLYLNISSPTDVDWYTWYKGYGSYNVTLSAPTGKTYYAELYSKSIGSSSWSLVGSTVSYGTGSTINYSSTSAGKTFALKVYSFGDWSDTEYYQLRMV